MPTLLCVLTSFYQHNVLPTFLCVHFFLLCTSVCHIFFLPALCFVNTRLHKKTSLHKKFVLLPLCFASHNFLQTRAPNNCPQARSCDEQGFKSVETKARHSIPHRSHAMRCDSSLCHTVILRNRTATASRALRRQNAKPRIASRSGVPGAPAPTSVTRRMGSNTARSQCVHQPVFLCFYANTALGSTLAATNWCAIVYDANFVPILLCTNTVGLETDVLVSGNGNK